ncbi:hypothetical protein GALMADRAFT_260338, partial [Galerina marginata CBS 339.88]
MHCTPLVTSHRSIDHLPLALFTSSDIYFRSDFSSIASLVTSKYRLKVPLQFILRESLQSVSFHLLTLNILLEPTNPEMHLRATLYSRLFVVFRAQCWSLLLASWPQKCRSSAVRCLCDWPQCFVFNSELSSLKYTPSSSSLSPYFGPLSSTNSYLDGLDKSQALARIKRLIYERIKTISPACPGKQLAHKRHHIESPPRLASGTGFSGQLNAGRWYQFCETCDHFLIHYTTDSLDPCL